MSCFGGHIFLLISFATIVELPVLTTIQLHDPSTLKKWQRKKEKSRRYESIRHENDSKILINLIEYHNKVPT